MTFLTLQGIGKSYGGAPALDRVDLAVPAGSRTVIVGPSASGKTTLLRIIAGFETPDHGMVILNGRTLANGPQAVPAHLRGIGYVAQDGALFPHLTVAGNIGFGMDLDGAAKTDRIAELLDMVDLPPAVLSRPPDQLSGGQQQRVAIARALAQRPRLMLLDEPFSALDAGLRETTRKAVGRLLSDAGITTILVTHDQAEALSFADQVAVLRNGRLEQTGSPRDLYLRPKNRAVAAYLGETIELPATIADGWATCALGRVHLDAATSRASGHIMLRPEQVRLVGVPAVGVDGSAVIVAEVTDIDFLGAVCAVSLRLGASAFNAGALRTGSLRDGLLVLTTSSRQGVAEVGRLVGLEIDGTAHVYDHDDVELEAGG